MRSVDTWIIHQDLHTTKTCVLWLMVVTLKADLLTTDADPTRWRMAL